MCVCVLINKRESVFYVADVMNIDTSGIHALEEVHQKLIARGLEVSTTISCFG